MGSDGGSSGGGKAGGAGRPGRSGGLPYSSKLSAPLNEQEQRAIYAYTHQPYRDLNRRLNEGTPLTAEQRDIVEGLDSGLGKAPSFNRDTYRVLGFELNPQLDGSFSPERDAFVAKHVVGDYVEYPAYVSASKSPTNYGFNKTDAPYTVRIRFSSRQAKDIKNMGVERDHEVTFARNSRFRVAAVERLKGGGYEIRLTD